MQSTIFCLLLLVCCPLIWFALIIVIKNGKVISLRGLLSSLHQPIGFLKSVDSVMGSIISIAGAFVLTFYKGPSIMNSSSLHQPIGFLKSVDSVLKIYGQIWRFAKYMVGGCSCSVCMKTNVS
jgi:hypothetical protein